MTVQTTEEILFPAYKISSTSWTDDDATSILHSTSGSPSCASTGLEWIEDEGDDDEIRFRLDSPDSYSFNFNEFEIHAYICGTDLGTQTQFQLKIGSETFTLSTANSGVSEWYSDTFESSTTYSASEVNFAQLWITADGRNHRDTKIPTIYVVAIGEYDIDQWDATGALEAGTCAGARHNKVFGGLEIEGEAFNRNSLIRFSSGGVRVGELQPRYSTGGVEVDGEAPHDNSIKGQGGCLGGGSATITITANPRTSGGVYVGGALFANGFGYRIPIVIPSASEPILGMLIGFPLYLPSAWTRYRIEDDEGNALTFEIVSQQGLKLSVFVKVNVRTTDQTIYFYSDGRNV